MKINVHAAERVGPVNAIGDYLYKVFGTGETPRGLKVQVTALVNRGQYEGVVRALCEDTEATHTTDPGTVLAIQLDPMSGASVPGRK